MNSIFDTNVWVALFNEKDGHHDAAQGLLSVWIRIYRILEFAEWKARWEAKNKQVVAVILKILKFCQFWFRQKNAKIQ